MNRHYVYAHYDGSVPQYIGMGKNGRAWSTVKRHKDHKEWMESYWVPSAFVEVIAVGMTQDEAYQLESSLIKVLNPRYNREKFKGQTGSNHHSSKLTEEQVLDIIKDSRIHRLIAEEYGVSRRTIGKIKTGDAWSHVQEQK